MAKGFCEAPEEVKEGTITYNTDNFTNNSSFVAVSGKVGVLQVSGKLLSSVTENNIHLMTLPVGFRPKNDVMVTIPVTTSSPGVLSISTNGKVVIYIGTSAQNWVIRGNLAFMI